jgi:lysophospholipase L1-like esterase
MKRSTRLALSLALIGICGIQAFATDYTWTGATSGAWNLSSNWNASSPPSPAYPNTLTDTATLTGGSNTAVTLGGTTPIASITFASGVTSGFTISGSSFTLAANGTLTKNAVAGNTTDTISSGITLNGDATFTNNDGNDFNNRNLVINGPITGSGTITIAGGGSGVVLSGNNTSFSGNVDVLSGARLLPGNSNAFGTGTVTLEAGSSVFFKANANTTNKWIIAGNANQGSFGANTQSGILQVNSGATYSVNNGDGNLLVLSGQVTGQGNINFTTANTTLSGTTSNTLSGTITNSANKNNTSYNTLTLAKTGGATAISGSLATSNLGIVQWNGNDQVSNSSAITMAGGTLAMNGHTDTVGTLTVTGSAGIDLGGGASALNFANSSGQAWSAGAELLVSNWTASRTVAVGTTNAGLQASQVTKVGFVNPDGSAAGLYHAAIAADGKLMPTGAAVTAANPKWDMSPSATAARTAVYSVPGLANLSGASTNLKPNTKISIFGDSITWLNGYITNINNALASGAGSSGLNTQVFNHGINGGGVNDILNGKANNAYTPGNTNAAQAAFNTVINNDDSDVAVVFIGVNDVHFLGTSASTFQTSLTSIVNQGLANGTKMVLCTVEFVGERPDGSNSDDTKMDQFAQITRDVAAATGVTLVDLRTAGMEYEKNNNFTLHLDGSLTYKDNGLLTYDGIHPTGDGNTFLANMIAQGINTALAPTAVPEPASLSLLLAGGALFLRRRRSARA